MDFHFPDTERTADEKRPGELGWQFLVRSSWPEAAETRSDIERWLNEYPADDRPRLLSRLTTGDDAVSRSAHTELVLHALLRRLASTVVVEPPTPSGGLTDYQLPGVGLDFEVYRLTTSRKRAAADQRAADVLAGLRKESSEEFWLSVNVEIPGAQPPSLRRIRTEIREWLATLDWASARTFAEAGGYWPQPKVWADPTGAWRIEVSAWPRTASARAAGPAVGVVEELDPFLPGIDALRTRLLDKLEQHRQLDRSLVLVVDVSAATFIHDDETEDALYGLTVLDTTTTPAREYRRRRACVWPDARPMRPVAVLVVQHLYWGRVRHARFVWMTPPGEPSCPLPGPWEVGWLGVDGRVHRDPAVFDIAALFDADPAA